MSIQIFFRTTAGITSPYFFSTGTNSAKLDGTASGWTNTVLATTRGAATTAATTNTVAGPTAGIEAAGITPFAWISAPLDADVTISGTITFNLWASELNMADNVAINCIIERINSTGAIVSTICQTARVTEVAQTTRAVNNFTATPTSTNMLKGDRLRSRVYGDDAGTMGAGGSFDFGYNGPTGGADGDSFVTFTETFGFLTTDPTTTTVYPTTVASSNIATADDDREIWTSRGSGANGFGAKSVTGWTAPVPCVNGTPTVSFWTKPLTAFTLAGPVLVNSRGQDQVGSKHAAIRAELAVCDSDGSNPVIWAATSHPTQLTTTETVYGFYLAGDDLAVTDGQVFRLRFYFDDESTTAMVSNATQNLIAWMNGTSGGASGDTFLTFGQTLTEYVTAAAGIPDLIMAPRIPA